MNKNFAMMVLQTVSHTRAEACPPPCVNTTNKLQPFGHQFPELLQWPGPDDVVPPGLALNVIGSPVNGLTPCRSLVAGLRTTWSFTSPGMANWPGPSLPSSRPIRSARAAKTAATSFWASPVARPPGVGCWTDRPRRWTRPGLVDWFHARLQQEPVPCSPDTEARRGFRASGPAPGGDSPGRTVEVAAAPGLVVVARATL